MRDIAEYLSNNPDAKLEQLLDESSLVGAQAMIATAPDSHFANCAFQDMMLASKSQAIVLMY